MSIADEGELRSLYREPHERILDKHIDHVDEAAADFLSYVTLIVVGTHGPNGADASPRGGPAGFVQVLDPGRVAFADLAGNNRLDTYVNITSGPAEGGTAEGYDQVGILAMIPGAEETLRINGRATISADEDIRRRVAIDDRLPKVAVVVDVDECYIHCGKALRRAGVWKPDTWPTGDAVPTAGSVIRAHMNIDAPAEAIDADLDAGYRETLWEHGGR